MLRRTMAVVLAASVMVACGGGEKEQKAEPESACKLDLDNLEGAFVWARGIGTQKKPEWLFRVKFYNEGGVKKATLLMGSPTLTRVQLIGEKRPDGTWQYVEKDQYEGEALERFKKTNTNPNNRLRVNAKVEVNESQCTLTFRDGWDTYVDGKPRWKQSDLGSKDMLPIPASHEFSFDIATERLRMFEAAQAYKAAEAEGDEYQQYMVDRMEEDFAAWSPLSDLKEGCTYFIDFYRNDRPVAKSVPITPEEKDGHLRWVYHHKFTRTGLGTAAMHRWRECNGQRERLGIADNIVDVAKELEVVAPEEQGQAKKG